MLDVIKCDITLQTICGILWMAVTKLSEKHDIGMVTKSELFVLPIV